MRMMEQKDILTVEDWTEAFSHVGSAVVRDDTKASLWAQPNPNSSNSPDDKPNRDTDYQGNKKPRGNSGYDNSYY